VARPPPTQLHKIRKSHDLPPVVDGADLLEPIALHVVDAGKMNSNAAKCRGSSDKKRA